MCEPVINKCNIPAKRPLLLLYTPSPTLRPAPMAQQVKNLPAMQETQEMLVWSLGLEDHLEKDTATHFSILAWEIPWTEEPGELQSMGLQRVGHYLATKPPTIYRCWGPSSEGGSSDGILLRIMHGNSYLMNQKVGFEPEASILS